MSNINEGYNHFRFNHSTGHFGRGVISTSRIESVWSELKSLLKKIYSTIRSQNFVYFLKEVEYRRSIKNLIGKEKLEDFATVYACVGCRNKNDFPDEDDLLSLEYESMYDD